MWKPLWPVILVFAHFSHSTAPVEVLTILHGNEGQVQQEPPRAVLRDGTPVRLRITRAISTGTAKVGDRVEFEVVQDVKVGDLVVIPRRTIAWGAVSELQPRRRPSRNAVLRLEIKAAKSVTAEAVQLRGSRTVNGDLTPQQAPWPILPLVFKGNEAFISRGGKVDAYVNGDASFDSALLRQSWASLEKRNAEVLAANTAGKTEVHIIGTCQTWLVGRQESIWTGPRLHAFRVIVISTSCWIREGTFFELTSPSSLLNAKPVKNTTCA